MTQEYATRLTKHLIKKLIGKKDPAWPPYKLEQNLNRHTLSQYGITISKINDQIERAPENENEEKYTQSEDPVVRQGWQLKKEVESMFRNKYIHDRDLRILIHVPDQKISPGGYSALLNLAETMRFMGIPTDTVDTKLSFSDQLKSFTPTHFLMIDHGIFTKDIDWQAIDDYRKHADLKIGLQALLPDDGNTALLPRLEWAKKQGINFYFSFKYPQYLNSRVDYRPFFDNGFKILSIPFGGNSLHYYPVPGLIRNINFCFIGSLKKTGMMVGPRVQKIFRDFDGFVDGPNWRHAKNFNLDRNKDRYIYAQSKVGFNFHNNLQMTWKNEVNERTHQLCLCGIPQITDNPRLLNNLYSPQTIFVADSDKQFLDFFMEIIHTPSFGRERILKAQKEAFDKHTTFHRAADFVNGLKDALL